MNKEKIIENIYNEIPKYAKVAIYGANEIGSKIKKDIENFRKDTSITCFIDDNIKDFFENTKVLPLKEAALKYKKEYDFIFFSIYNDIFINNILCAFKIPFAFGNEFLFDYYSNKHEMLSDKNYENVINIFNDDDDKKIFDMMFKRRCKLIGDIDIQQYYYEKYYNETKTIRTISKQYLEKINKTKATKILDLGFNCGINAVAFCNLLPNLKIIHAFEPIYEMCKNEFIENFIPKDKLVINKIAIGDKKTKTKFYINNNHLGASLSSLSTSIPYKNMNINHKEIEIEVTTIDDYCSENDFEPDFIKMDIEGAELAALKGGIKTMTKTRPQLAISIYHNDYDFINIPQYLSENLKDYAFRIGQYSPDIYETILYAIPNEIH